MNGEGAINTHEFELMMKVMGCELSQDQVVDVMAQAKDGFAAWREASNQENIDKCRKTWDEYDTNGDGQMDLLEINAVIAKLREMGSASEPLTAVKTFPFALFLLTFRTFWAHFDR